MKKATLDLDKHSKKSMHKSFVLQGMYYGVCTVTIILCLIYPHVQTQKLRDFFLFSLLCLVAGISLGGIPIAISNFLISLFALPTERGKKRTLWILWTVLAPILGFVLFWCSCGLFVVTTGI